MNKIIERTRKRIRSLPIRTKQLLGLGIVLSLLVALPLFVLSLLAPGTTFDIRERAASGEITPTPTSWPSGTCWNRVAGSAGSYYWPDSCKGTYNPSAFCLQATYPLTSAETVEYQKWLDAGRPYIPNCGMSSPTPSPYASPTPSVSPYPTGTPSPVIIPSQTGCVKSPAYTGDLCGPNGYRRITSLQSSSACYTLEQCLPNQGSGTCVKSPTYVGDLCGPNGYRVMPGIDRGCYSLTECITLLGTPTPSPSPTPSISPYPTGTPAPKPTISPTPTPKPTVTPTPYPFYCRVVPWLCPPTPAPRPTPTPAPRRTPFYCRYLPFLCRR